MGIDSNFGRAFAKAQIQAGNSLPRESGTVLVSVRASEHDRIGEPMKKLADLGYEILATRGTGASLSEAGLAVSTINKVYEGSPHTADRIESGGVVLVINTVDADPKSIEDSKSMRRAALLERVPYCTTLAAARASVDAILALHAGSIGVRSLQQIHELGV
jgi:carbamoyl-phosphate synthase large subunit